MKITVFCQKVAKLEAGKAQVNIAQIAQIVKIINKQTNGILYDVIELL